MTLDDSVQLANNTAAWVEHSLHYNKSELMVKIQDYVPPVKEELEYQEIRFDSYYRPMSVPHFFYSYFIDTFMIPSYTCDNINANLTYQELSPKVYTCFCNNDDYHSLPTINLELIDYDIQYDLDAKDYLLLPYINYTRPVSLCVFAVAE